MTVSGFFQYTAALAGIALILLLCGQIKAWARRETGRRRHV